MLDRSRILKINSRNSEEIRCRSILRTTAGSQHHTIALVVWNHCVVLRRFSRARSSSGVNPSNDSSTKSNGFPVDSTWREDALLSISAMLSDDVGMYCRGYNSRYRNSIKGQGHKGWLRTNYDLGVKMGRFLREEDEKERGFNVLRTSEHHWFYNAPRLHVGLLYPRCHDTISHLSVRGPHERERSGYPPVWGWGLALARPDLFRVSQHQTSARSTPKLCGLPVNFPRSVSYVSIMLKYCVGA